MAADRSTVLAAVERAEALRGGWECPGVRCVPELAPGLRRGERPRDERGVRRREDDAHADRALSLGEAAADEELVVAPPAIRGLDRRGEAVELARRVRVHALVGTGQIPGAG